MNIENAIIQASKFLKKNNIYSFNLDSEILMSRAIKKDKKYLILNQKKQMEYSELKHYQELINKRASGKPIAYLTGNKNFWKYNFKVNENVLIPRPETELIVEQVLKLYKNKSKLRILDIGVGSGCIILSLLKEKKDFLGVGIDKSKKSLDVCNLNTLNLNLKNRLKLFNFNIDNFSYGKYDVIISNPPYINKLKIKYLDKDVRNFEPKMALNGGLDGISEIRKVIIKSSELIKRNGKLILEIGFDQKNKVKNILKKNGFKLNKVLKDLAKMIDALFVLKFNKKKW